MIAARAANCVAVLIAALVAVLFAAACAAPTPAHVDALDLPTASSQVLLSTTADWSATAATLQRWQRTDDGWHAIGAPIAARIGRSGLGWGLGLHRDGPPAEPQKREGDGRAPAGVFSLGTAFGYAPTPPDGVTVHYRQATARDYFVDAVDSADYNRWQRIPQGEPNDPATRWSSCERMRRDDAVYELGMVVEHNTVGTVPGRGSAIFLHVWTSPTTATSGCTSMAKEDLITVLRWLRDDAEPLLVQLPAGAAPARLR